MSDNKKGYVSPFVSEETKNTKEWHVQNHQYYLRDGLYDIAKGGIGARAREFYMGDFDPLYEHSFLTVSDSGVEYPVDAINFNAILPIVEQMVGMFSDRGYSFDVHALSQKAISRKTEAKLAIEADFDLLPLAMASQEMTGAAFIPEGAPMNRREVEEKQKSYKDMSEIIMQRLLNDFVTRYKLELSRQVMYRDSNVYGDCHIMLEYKNGYLIPTMLRPGEVFYDANSRDPLLTDARFYMVLRYISVTEAYNRHTFNHEDFEKLAKMGNPTLQLGAYSSNHSWPIFRGGPGGRQVLESTLYWKDVRVREGTLNVDKYGNRHYGIRDMYGKSRKKPMASKEIQVEQIRYCTMLGGSICPDDGWGVVDWVPRTVDDNWTKTGFPIKSLVPRLIEGRQKSTVDLLEPLQGMRDRCFYMVNKAMKKDKGKGILYDRSQQPEGYELEDLIYELDKSGIMEIESRQFGSNAGYNQFQQIDMSVSPAVQVYIGLAQMCRDEMMRIAGLSDAAMGQVKGASQTLGTTQSSIAQTQVRHDWYFRLFDLFTQEILQFAGGVLKKCVVDNPDRFRNIIGDDGVRFLQTHPDMDLEDIGVSIFVDNKAIMDQKMIQEMTTFGIQNGFVDYVDGIRVMMARDEKEMYQILDEIHAEMRARQEQQRQLEGAQIQQAQANEASIKAQQSREQQQMKLLDIQSRERIAAQNNETRIRESMARNSSELQQAIMNNRARARQYTPRI